MSLKVMPITPGAFPRDRDVLTGESSTQHLYGFEVVGADAAHVVKALRVRPVHGEHAATPGIALHLPADRP